MNESETLQFLQDLHRVTTNRKMWEQKLKFYYIYNKARREFDDCVGRELDH